MFESTNAKTGIPNLFASKIAILSVLASTIKRAAGNYLISLMTRCKSESLFDYDDLISVALDNKFINNNEADSLREWRIDPEKWGEKFT